MEAIKNNIAVSTVDEVVKLNSYLAGLPPTVYWKPLTLSATSVPEPTNEDGSLWSPTELEGKTQSKIWIHQII